MSTRIPHSGNYGETHHLESTIRAELPVQVVLAESPLEASSLRETLRVSSGCRVLLVEDNPINLFMMQRLLDKFQCRVDSAETGKEALDRLAAEDYKAVLLDIHLPDMDGVEVCRRIRSGADCVRNPSIPIIALTAHAMAGDRETFLSAGMNGYLPKPINLNFLIETLKIHCN